MKMRKLAVLSHILPPSPSGQSMILHRLLRAVPSADYCLISREDYAHEEAENDPLRLQAPYYRLPPEFQLQRPNSFNLYKVKELSNLLWQIFGRARRVVKVARAEQCGAIMACSGDLADIPAGYLASRWLRLPFYVYLFDDWINQWTRRLHQWFVSHIEPFAMKGATAVIVPNEFLRDEYQRRYGVNSTVIHNPYENIETVSFDNALPGLGTSEVSIVFTGAIYHANYDAFRNLVVALEQLGRPDLRLHLYTPQHPDLLKDQHICGPVVYHEHVPAKEVQRIQKQANILFLPLSFNSECFEVIKTSAPGKMGEYMASGRPILAHAPSGSFVSWYFRKHQCGAIVDRAEPKTLANAINQLLDDVDFQRSVVKNAHTRAATDFNLSVAQARFRSLLFQQDGV